MPTQHDHLWMLAARSLSGEATPEQQMELEQALQADPSLNYVMEVMQAVWASQPAVDPEYAESRYKSLIAELRSSNPRQFETNDPVLTADDRVDDLNIVPIFRRWKTWAYSLTAAAALIVAGIFYFQGPESNAPANAPALAQEVSTKNGSKTSLILPDGSKVWLNAGSKLVYDKQFGQKLREVRLTGEAYFDVAHDKTRPFIIHTEQMDIRVLGTAFNVKCYPGEGKTEAALVRGSIEVTMRNRNEKFVLKPNEKLVLNSPTSATQIEGQAATVKAVSKSPLVVIAPLTPSVEDEAVIIETSWLENKLIFQDETFQEVATKMERWYGVTIRFAEPSLGRIRLTGSFENENINQALTALQYIARFKYHMEKDIITISK